MTVNPESKVAIDSEGISAKANIPQPSEVRLVFLTNIIAPYWKTIFDALSPRYRNMRVLLSTRMEANRQWAVDWDGLDVVVQKTATLKRLWRHPKGFSERAYLHLPLDTIQQLRRFDAEVVISNEMGFRTLLALLYRKSRRSSRLIVWAEMSQSTEQGRGWMRRALRRLLQKHVDGFVVLGESGACYIRSLGTDERKIFRVPYTTDVHRFAATALTRRDDRARRLLYVGQLIERKGLLPFVGALSRWAVANPDRTIEFVLVGVGPLRARLERESTPANLRLTFLGNIGYADLPNVYAESGIFAFPTLADSWGVVVNEALASALPVLGSVSSQAVEELVEDGRNGWLFDPDKPDAIYTAIDASMTASLNLLNDMRQNARTTALQLTPDYVAGRIEETVRSVIRTR